MADEPPIPPILWHRVREFLEAGCTGQLVIHVVRGQVVGLDTNAVHRLAKKVALDSLPIRGSVTGESPIR